MRRRSAYGGGVLVMTAALLATACSGTPGTKAGGDTAPVTLRMANTYAHLDYEPAVQDFVTRLQKNSDGKVRVDVVHEWGGFRPDAEQKVVKAVADGEADLAWVGTRVLDTLGVRGFQALNAPLLIDSYALQEKVVASDVPKRMLKGLDKLDVTGLAVLAGGLRKPISVERPLLGPKDWRGLSVQTFPSALQADTIRALGAKPVQVGPQDRDAGLKSGSIDGFENSLRIYALNSLESLAPHLALNVNLWPETAVLLANPERLAELGDSAADRVREAAAEAAARSTALVGADDDALVIERCGSGAHFGHASDGELSALRTAVEPVYRRLEKDPDTKAYLADIRALKESVSRETSPPGPAPCSAEASGPTAPATGGESSARLDGTYRWTLTKADARDHGTESEDLSGYPSTFTTTLRGGEWTMKQTAEPEIGNGTYEVRGRHITFLWPDHPSVRVTFTKDGKGNLRIRPVEPMDAGDRFVWTTHPWTKVG